MEFDFDKLVIIVLLVGMLIQQFWIKGMIPLGIADKLIKELEAPVESTPNKLDDFLLEVGKMIAGLQRDTGTDIEVNMDGETKQDLENGGGEWIEDQLQIEPLMIKSDRVGDEAL